MSESVYRVECVFFFFKRESFFCVELERVLKERRRERSEFHPPKESVVVCFAREKEFAESGELITKRAPERRTYYNEAKRSLLARSSTHIK